jgi:hypothetical protein
MNKPKSRAADNAALRERKAEAGLINYRAWVTKQEKLRMSEFLDDIRSITPIETRNLAEQIVAMKDREQPATKEDIKLWAELLAKDICYNTPTKD